MMQNQASLIRPAFVGYIERTIPLLDTGTCPSLAEKFGGLESFGKGACPDMRWEVLLVSDWGKELKETWKTLKEQTVKTAAYLEEEVRGPLTSEVHGVWDRRTNRTTCMLMWEQGTSRC